MAVNYDGQKQNAKDSSPDPSPEYIALAAFDTDLNPMPKGIRCSAAGDVELMKYDGTKTIIPGVLAGEYLPCMFKQVVDAGTTAAVGTFTLFY